MPKLPALLVLVCVAAGCGGGAKPGGASCGIAAMVGPTQLLNQFTIPQMTLSRAPRSVPERLPARIAAGGAFSSVVGASAQADSVLLVGVEGDVPANFVLGFGVLVVTPSGTAKGIMLYQGPPITGAPQLGTVSFGAMNAPLLGVEADASVYEDPSCAVFPDSLRK
jgi:hypothetical protein